MAQAQSRVPDTWVHDTTGSGYEYQCEDCPRHSNVHRFVYRRGVEWTWRCLDHHSRRYNMTKGATRLLAVTSGEQW